MKFDKSKLCTIPVVREEVYIPEFEDCIECGIIYVSQLPIRKKAEIDSVIMANTEYKEHRGKIRTHNIDNGAIFSKIIIECVCDASGARIFNESDAELILDLPSAIVEKIVTVYKDLNEPKLKEVEDAVKN